MLGTTENSNIESIRIRKCNWTRLKIHLTKNEQECSVFWEGSGDGTNIVFWAQAFLVVNIWTKCTYSEIAEHDMILTINKGKQT